MFLASRYDKGDESYLNSSLSREAYEKLVGELMKAETVKLKSFEKKMFFEGCLPVEEMAKRGKETLRYGPLKPVGLKDPKDGRMPYAVVQLRQDNIARTLYNIVGFQTNLKIGEQKRVFGLIPGLEKAEYARYGMMHRNTFINSPKCLSGTMSLMKEPSIYFAGQITGVEGYLECALSGLVTALNVYAKISDYKNIVLPETSISGSLMNYVVNSEEKKFTPMNVNFGILPPLEKKYKKTERYLRYYKRAAEDLRNYINKREEVFKKLS